MKQKQSAPYWSTSLVTLCRTLSNRRQDASSNEEEEEDEEGVRGLMEETLQLLEEVHKLQNLQHLCGALQGRGERVRRTPATVCVCVCFLRFLHCLNFVKPKESTYLKSDMFTSPPQTFGKVATLRPLLSTTRTLFSLSVLFPACLFPLTLNQPAHLCLPCSSYSRNLWNIWRRTSTTR